MIKPFRVPSYYEKSAISGTVKIQELRKYINMILIGKKILEN